MKYPRFASAYAAHLIAGLAMAGALAACEQQIPVDLPSAGDGPSPAASATPSRTPTATPTPTGTPLPTTGMRALPTPLYGVTLDDTSSLSSITQSLGSLSRRPIARVVFDENVPASSYTSAVQQIYSSAYVMGEILDSQFVNQANTSEYLARTTEYLDAMDNYVDLWEVGNEINGEWVGDTATVATKMAGAYDLVKARGKRAALTLYYNGPSDDGSASCWSSRDHQMFNWAQANVPQRMKDGLDYVLISFYEDDCNGIQPDWTSIFTLLGQMFPNSKIGFGEVGTQDSASKASYINRYYSMQVPVRNYIGGYFWWYFREDGVPMNNPLWNTVNSVFATGPEAQAGRAGGHFDRLSRNEPITWMDRLAALALVLTMALAILLIVRKAGRATAGATTTRD